MSKKKPEEPRESPPSEALQGWGPGAEWLVNHEVAGIIAKIGPVTPQIKKALEKMLWRAMAIGRVVGQSDRDQDASWQRRQAGKKSGETRRKKSEINARRIREAMAKTDQPEFSQRMAAVIKKLKISESTVARAMSVPLKEGG